MRPHQLLTAVAGTAAVMLVFGVLGACFPPAVLHQEMLGGADAAKVADDTIFLKDGTIRGIRRKGQEDAACCHTSKSSNNSPSSVARG